MARLVEATGAAEVALVRELFAEYARVVDGAARDAGCARIVLDTLPKMREAQALYGLLGFKRIEPYLREPTPGAICFELRLP